VCPYYFEGGAARSKEFGSIEYYKMLRSETRLWIGNKQARPCLQRTKTDRRGGKVVIGQEWKAGGKEIGLRGTTAGSVERAACPIHIPGEVAQAQIQNQDLTENHAPQRVLLPDASQARSQISDALANCNVIVSSSVDATFTWMELQASRLWTALREWMGL
jgi:hypothetical protein